MKMKYYLCNAGWCSGRRPGTGKIDSDRPAGCAMSKGPTPLTEAVKDCGVVVGGGWWSFGRERYAEVPVHTKSLYKVLSAAIGLSSHVRFQCLERVFASLFF